MRFLIVLCVFALALYSCDTTGSVAKSSDAEAAVAEGDTVRIANEELEYEIIIIEPGFYNWLVTQFPEEYYSMSFLKNRNIFYVAEFNRRVLLPTVYDPDLYLFTIDYEPNVDYGKEVNYLLYNYFVYFQEKYNQKLI